MPKWLVVSALLVTTMLLATVSGQQTGSSGDFVDGEILVKFSPAANAFQRNAILSNRGATRLRRFNALGIEHVRVQPRLGIAAAIAMFEGVPGVVLAQPNYVRRAIRTTPPDDPLWLDQSLWGLAKIGAHSVWSDFTVGDGSVVIANIDTGVDYTHPDLSANMWRNPLETPGNGIDDDGNGYVDDVYGIDTVNHDTNPIDDHGHGTHTSGTAAAAGNNGIGVVGVNWNAKILACKFLSASGSGTDAGAIECFDYIVALKNRGENIRVSSNSWGSPRGSGPPAVAVQAAIDAAGAAGIINVFGAGNEGTNNDAAPFDPASYTLDSIVSVASSGRNDGRSVFSNYGATSVDLAAPGEDILSTYPGAAYSYASGTSMATPHVAGVAALLAKMDPAISVPAIKSLLLDNVDQSGKWAGRVASGGRLNAFRAASALGPGSNNTPPEVSITSPIAGATFREPATFTIDATASDSDGSVQRVTFYANGAPIGVATTSPYTVTWTNAPAGSYMLTAVATDDRWATTTSAAVQVTVLANTPPLVSISTPSAGAVFTTPVDVAIEATASDPDGTVQQVAFYANGTAIGTAAAAPYGVSWYAPAGTHTLTAVATDNQGATTTSEGVIVTVNPIPDRINVAMAANGGVATASSTLNANYPPAGAINGDRRGLNWGAGGGWNDGTPNSSPDWLEVRFAGVKMIEEIDVFSMQDAYSAPVEPTPALTFSYFGLRAFDLEYWDGAAWAPVPGGSVTNNNLVWRKVVFAPLMTSRIRVHITGGLNGYSRVMEVEAWGVATGANTPPTVSLTSPAGGAAFTAPASIVVSASAGDSDGTIAQVDFFADGAPIGSATVSPYSITWSNVQAGSYALTAIATDDRGGTETSAPVQVTVSPPNSPPTVSIDSPGDGAAFTALTNIAIGATAFDSDGSILRVAFYANGVLLGTDTTSPYGLTWPLVAAGDYTLTAVATDNQQATATSAPVQVTVSQSPGRMNVALAANGGVASASSTLNANYPAAGAINGDRKGLNWGAGGGWNDATPNTSPDWLEVAFSGAKVIDEVNVFSMQDAYSAPIEPTPAMTFSYWGLRAFEVQYWTGAAWAAVPGASVTANNLVWRRFVFAPVATSRIRVHITGGLNGYSRVMEVEAWGLPAGGNAPPIVALTSPASGASFTAPATITIDASASDTDGSISQVAFYANGAPIGTDTTSPYSITWTSVPAGSYTITAVATDSSQAATTSAPVLVSVNQQSQERVNVALAANGGVATASSTLNANYPASGAINGDRKGLKWGAGGGWNDGTLNTSPDWIEVAFDGPKVIDEVNVFSMQDAYSAPVEPTPTMTFAYFGLRAFEVQYWNGTAWLTVPGGAVTGNNLVWRRFQFAPVTSTKIRVLITGALNGYSRVIEVEAWGQEDPGGPADQFSSR